MESGGLAEALLVENGVIAAVGTREKLAGARGAARSTWMGVRCCLRSGRARPFFRRRAGAAAGPAGGGRQLDEIGQALSHFITANKIPDGQWVVGKSYDQNTLAEAPSDHAHCSTAFRARIRSWWCISPDIWGCSTLWRWSCSA